MQYPQYQSQPQQANSFPFYQPNVDSGGNSSVNSAQAPPPPLQPPAYVGYHRSTNSTHFFSGEEDVNNQQNLQYFSQPHAMSIGMTTPTFSGVESCSSQKGFGFGNIPASNGAQDSPFRQYSTTIGAQAPSLATASKPFVQMSLPSPSSSSSLQMMSAPYAPVFHNSALQAPQPFNQQQQQQQQQQYWYQQQTHQEVQPMPVPPLHSQRSGYLANLLNVLLPQDSSFGGGGAPQETTIPLHQRRFGYPEDDLPLLEELGIIPRKIRCRALAVLNPFKSMSQDAVEDMDLAGPVVFAVSLGFLLSLQGKLEFNTIYGHSLFGVIFMKVLLSLMTEHGVALQFVISALGYCLIPNLILAACQSFVYWLIGFSGNVMLVPALLIVLWSAWCATAMLVNGLSMEKQRYLILYPIFLFYAVFATLTIF